MFAFTELGQFEIVPLAVRAIPRPFGSRQGVVILGDLGDPTTVGMLDPNDAGLLREIADLIRRPIQAVRLNRFEIDRALAVGWEADSVEPADLDIDLDAIVPGANGRIEDFLALAIEARASDVHIETYRGDVDVRVRVDGILHQTFTALNPESVMSAVSRIKVLAKLDIAERRRPQDGRFRAALRQKGHRRVVDLRVSIVPGLDGEDTVLRVLDPEKSLVPLEKLGLQSDDEALFTKLFANPEGLFLVTGPTGSGKTTTLYAALAHLNDGRRKIVTAEDPVEYVVPKVNQKQVASGDMQGMLRSLLRHDPNVIMVGEIRDPETASLAVSAASTGHLVLSTIHTSDALGAVSRLRRLGVDDADIADALLASSGQRLARQTCPRCVEASEPTENERSTFGSLLLELTAFRGRGCAECQHTGFRGRLGIFELLVVSRQLGDAITRGAHGQTLWDLARSQGLRTMVEDGLDKVRGQRTALQELVRVLPFRQIVTVRDHESPVPVTPVAP